uniref:CenH3 n=1 Tax=Arundo donax TaxID=35708 RepID=A0A0A9AVD8_ARUDO
MDLWPRKKSFGPARHFLQQVTSDHAHLPQSYHACSPPRRLLLQQRPSSSCSFPAGVPLPDGNLLRMNGTQSCHFRQFH